VPVTLTSPQLKMLESRILKPVGIDKTAEEAEALGEPLTTVFPSANSRGAVQVTGVTYRGILPKKTRKGDDPCLYFNGHEIVIVRAKTTYRFKASPVFALAKKMNAPSLSLPSGPPEIKGVCAIASSEFRGDKPGKFICDGCYAVGVTYRYAAASLAQAARLQWIRETLKADPTGTKLAQNLVGAISDYARKSTLHHRKTARITQQLGTWDHGKIIVPFYMSELDETEPHVTRVRKYSDTVRKLTGHDDSLAVFSAMKPPPSEGEIVGFFRIHDSGELSVGSNKMNKAYLHALVEVANEHHQAKQATHRDSRYRHSRKRGSHLPSRLP